MKILMRQVQRTVSASHLSAGRPWSLMAKRLAMRLSQGLWPGFAVACPELVEGSSSLSRTSEICSMPSLRPRSSASARCEGMAPIASE